MRGNGELASKRRKKNTGDVFYRYVDAEDGSQMKYRGYDVDPELYETLLRMDYEDSESDGEKTAVSEGGRGSEGRRRGKEEREGRDINDKDEIFAKYRNILSQYDTLSCGYAADGSVRRLPKGVLRYSKEKLFDLLDEIFKPRLNKRRSPMSFKYR